MKGNDYRLLLHPWRSMGLGANTTIPEEDVPKPESGKGFVTRANPLDDYHLLLHL